MLVFRASAVRTWSNVGVAARFCKASILGAVLFAALLLEALGGEGLSILGEAVPIGEGVEPFG